jgi:predicted metal-dependent phosphoesterase TrpH
MELIDRAHQMNVDTLAITDHDTVDGLNSLQTQTLPIKLISGIELSSQWQGVGIHVLGLNIDHLSDATIEAASVQTAARSFRAEQIAQNLEKQGIEGSLEGAREQVNGGYVGRPHFAQWMVKAGKVKDVQAAFKQYLGAGKAGDIQQHWADLPQVIEWIRDANGIAVLAHPLKYKMTLTRLKRLLDDFVKAGGQGMEVISGQQTNQQTTSVAQLCNEKGLLASCGSDFHFPDKPWAELGKFATLPTNVTPVWDQF